MSDTTRRVPPPGTKRHYARPDPDMTDEEIAAWGVSIRRRGVGTDRQGGEQARTILLSRSTVRAAYRHDLRAWFSWCSDHDLDPLLAQRAHVDAYARTLGEVEDRSPATVARHLSALSGFYRYALAEDLVARNPVANVRRPKVGTDTVSTGLSRESNWLPSSVWRRPTPPDHSLWCSSSGSTVCGFPRPSVLMLGICHRSVDTGS